jgi:hypothetical protein
MICSVSTTSTKNKFVQLAIERVLLLALELKGASYLREQLKSGYDIVIAGDNDFYSQRAQVCFSFLPNCTLSSYNFLIALLYSSPRGISSPRSTHSSNSLRSSTLACVSPKCTRRASGPPRR